MKKKIIYKCIDIDGNKFKSHKFEWFACDCPSCRYVHKICIRCGETKTNLN